MNTIYLPELLSIKIRNFSIYKKDINFKFIKGLNLIVGGNGLGKTTFVNLIRYGLIGLYKKDLDVRTYKGEKRLFRTQYPKDYFKNRMDETYQNRESAEIEIEFKVNQTVFIVKRGLYEIILKSVLLVNDNEETQLSGNIIRQDQYERLNEGERKECLQFKYEEKVAEVANISNFNDIIFFVNQVLFFDEDRKTIVWEPYIQERLSSKYFNDPALDKEFQEAKRQAKYHDSMARHKSEDMRAINKVIERIKPTEGDDRKELVIIAEISELNKKIEFKNEKLKLIQQDRKEQETLINRLTHERMNHNKKCNDYDKRIREEEEKIYTDVWGRLNPKYKLYLDNIRHMQTCPLCNNDLEEDLYNELIENEEDCILCKSEIKKKKLEPINVKSLKNELENELKKVQNLEKDIFNHEAEMVKLDKEYSKVRNELFEAQSKLRSNEHLIYNNDDKSDETVAYTAMLARIDELHTEKGENLKLSNEYNLIANNIIKNIEGNLSKITKDLSSIFSKFAGAFLGVECKLSFDNFEGENIKMYIPVINGKPRTDPLELSESQRFFTDQSFRMSLLAHFYNAPTFFVCETPDSSLDISYEANAAEIFLKYLENPNTLIITSNLNNSGFLDLIIEKSEDINYLNLLEYGQVSAIQLKDSNIYEISKRIGDKISEKQK